jgi:hypothetical protein
MKKMQKPLLLAPLAVAVSLATTQAYAESESISDAVKNGKADLSFRMRYEEVDADYPSTSPNKDEGHATTLKTRLTFNTDSFKGFAAGIEFDDVSAVDQNNYNDGSNGYLAPAIVDPEGTEINQVFISNTSLADTTLKYGRQRIVLDNQRFVGGVAWRQNEQTYDSFTVTNKSLADTTIFYGYVYNIQGIKGEGFNTRTNTSLLNVKYEGLSIGSITAYAYLLDNDEKLTGANPAAASSDTYGVRFNGSVGDDDIKYLYTAELATQSDAGDNPVSYDTTYMLLEGGIAVSGITTKLGYEVLGSDDGAKNSMGGKTLASFQTPLATKHAFQGWTDQFLNTPAEGIADLYVSVSGELAGVKLMAVYHQYTADEESAASFGYSGGEDDLGSEYGFVAAKQFGDYGLQLKYSDYSAGDDYFGKIDTSKL